MIYTVPINDQTWLICGGRDFANQDIFNSAMSDLILDRGMPKRIITGGARGADLMGKEWAKKHAIEAITVLADWAKYAHAAGPIRNQAMLDKYSPNLVVAFPGGKGTADMVRRSNWAKVLVAEIVLPP